MNKAFKVFDTALKSIIVLNTIAMVVVGFSQVYTRYVMKTALPWSEELMRYCFIWSTFLCVPVAVVERRHTTITTLSDKLNSKGKLVHELIICAIELAIFLCMIYSGVSLILKNMNSVSPAMQVPMRYVIASVPTSGALGIFYLIKHVSSVLKCEI